MAFNNDLAELVRKILSGQIRVVEKKMFGGVGFLVNGNMICGILREDLIVRIGLSNYEWALQQTGVRQFDITGRIMKGWIMISPAGIEDKNSLKRWTDMGVDFALTLPPKESNH